tara:strand:+ start:390 stop:593 length:204 start_codon:yes stop_codon:yes gene_type:complete
MPPPHPEMKTNQEMLLLISKSLSSLHKRQDDICKRLENLEKELIDFKNQMPVRKSGWLNDFWEIKKN